MSNFTTAIIVAAGNSTRMGLDISKQLIMLGGKPVIKHTIEVFDRCQDIDEIVLVCRQCDITDITSAAQQYKKVTSVTVGGDTRLDSVKNGIAAADSRAEFYAIHDGARPMVTVDDISKVVECAKQYGAATLGTYVTDTIKIADNDVVLSTPDRSALRAVQTPQVFEKELYIRALQNAVESKLTVTDDCSMIEAVGDAVHIVIGSNENIKLTTQTDLIFAQAILDKRQQ